MNNLLSKASKTIKHILIGSIKVNTFLAITKSRIYEDIVYLLDRVNEFKDCSTILGDSPSQRDSIMKIINLRKEEWKSYKDHIDLIHKFDKTLQMAGIRAY